MKLVKRWVNRHKINGFATSSCMHQLPLQSIRSIANIIYNANPKIVNEGNRALSAA